MTWQIILTPEVSTWFLALDARSAALVRDSVELLAQQGPSLGRPAADRVHGSRLHNLKELRPGSRGGSRIRILFLFDPARQAVLLVAGDKAGRWQTWYTEAIKLAEERYERYLSLSDEEIE